MKLLPIIILLGLLLVACGTPQPEEVETPVHIPDSAAVDQATDTQLTSAAENLIWNLEGEYFLLREEDGSIYYDEPCTYNHYDVKIAESAEGSGEWELYSLGDWYPIAQAEEKNGTIHITTDSDLKNEFIFRPTENDLLWNFVMVGNKEASPIVRTKGLENFNIRPCTDAAEIMKGLFTTWYQLSEIDGQTAVYYPCEDAPDGLTIGENGESIEFWNGSDPYEVLSMRKANNRVAIVYMTAFREDSVTMHQIYGDVVQFGEGTIEDASYVREGALQLYPIVKEECDGEEEDY